MIHAEEPGLQITQNVTAVDGFAYGVIGADLHVHANGLPLYLLANWCAAQPDNPGWLRELPSRMLNARRGVVPFTGRANELAQLRLWRDAGPRLAVRWLHSAGGQGKTRLADRLAEESASDGWKVITAFQGSDADIPEPGSQDMRLADASGLLMIMDYADRWRMTNLTWLLKNALLHRAGPAVRVLMVARTTDSWPLVRGILDTHQADSSIEALPDLGQETGERQNMFDAALTSFGVIYGLPDIGTAAAPVSLDDMEFGLTLAVHMAALVTVDAFATGQHPPPDAAGLSMYLLDREQLHWARLHADAACSADAPYRTPPQVMNQTVFTAALTGSVSRAAGTALLANLGLPDPDQVLQDHAVSYPPPDPGQKNVLEPLYPDRLAEDFLALTMPGHLADYPAQAWAPPQLTHCWPATATQAHPRGPRVRSLSWLRPHSAGRTSASVTSTQCSAATPSWPLTRAAAPLPPSRTFPALRRLSWTPSSNTCPIARTPISTLAPRSYMSVSPIIGSARLIPPPVPASSTNSS